MHVSHGSLLSLPLPFKSRVVLACTCALARILLACMLQGIHRWGAGLKPLAKSQQACAGLVIITAQGEVPAAIRRR